MHAKAERARADPACDVPCYNIQQRVRKRRSKHCKMLLFQENGETCSP